MPAHCCSRDLGARGFAPGYRPLRSGYTYGPTQSMKNSDSEEEIHLSRSRRADEALLKFLRLQSLAMPSRFSVLSIQHCSVWTNLLQKVGRLKQVM